MSKLTVSVHFRNPTDAKFIELAAQVAGLKPSEFVKRAAFQAALKLQQELKDAESKKSGSASKVSGTQEVSSD